MKLKELIGEDWFKILQPFLISNYFKKIQQHLVDILQQDKTTLVPSLDYVFQPFKLCPYRDLKVVILNDIPLRVQGHNDGLAFSQLKDDIHGDSEGFLGGIENEIYNGFQMEGKDRSLVRLSKQGVLLLNASPTLHFTEGNWIRHDEIWEPFINFLLRTIVKETSGTVFILCGKDVRKFAKIILPTQNYLLTCTHPRDASHFAQEWDAGGVFEITNMILKQNINKEIIW